MGTRLWSGLLLLHLGMAVSIADSDEMVDGRERDFLRLSKRVLLRLSKKSGLNPDYQDRYAYQDQDMSSVKRDILQLAKRDLLRLTKKSPRSLRLSKRSSGPAPVGSSKRMDQPMVI